MKIARTLSAAAVLLLFAVNVSAGEGKGMKGHMPAFSDIDHDGDGKVVEQEFNDFHAQRIAERAAEGRELKNAGKCSFAGIDTDSDGSITPEEFKAHQAGHMNKGKHKHMHKHGHGEKQEEQKSET